ncbi:MAG: hypothetical protein FWD98_04940 [Defluviitaleaceae bacterium]|nr:hypothetical protein [Defluviitaleaceae bacterium]
MNINCTEKCAYQHDGKCGLNSLSNLQAPDGTVAAPAWNSCPYYRS